ncbi:M23 family metallopeptidase [Aquicoccus sp. G2-2]|uniref:M23 family metallopeptidase n=1 Tax=Aquicoccus sp. G2-2 TaxID=3092120 RepID=UPI002ADF5350|nr:M23 family metallopeptidase [Aquicoccus sp. G2-2]MEA1112193.1 M23 family metallopeptidase [Aquicoccus sp. G2-2]
MTRLTAALAFLICASPATAGEAPHFAQPVACTIGTDCYIQNYVDADPGPGYHDFQCNALSYDGHKGTDFALYTRADIARGVAVIAAAPGTVLGTRDGMQDGAFLSDPASIGKRDCGNGLVIDLGDGWQTQYCHMRKGSIIVKSGQQVAAGTKLGEVGQSGRAAFPHLHLSIRHNGKPVDPFNPTGAATCPAPSETLWQAPGPAYLPGGLLASGFSVAMPRYDAIKAGTAAQTTLPPDTEQLTFWSFGFGFRSNDMLKIEVTGPEKFHETHRVLFDKSQAQAFRAFVKRIPGIAWPTGTYYGRATLLRGGNTIAIDEATLEIKP